MDKSEKSPGRRPVPNPSEGSVELSENQIGQGWRVIRRGRIGRSDVVNPTLSAPRESFREVEEPRCLSRGGRNLRSDVVNPTLSPQRESFREVEEPPCFPRGIRMGRSMRIRPPVRPPAQIWPITPMRRPDEDAMTQESIYSQDSSSTSSQYEMPESYSPFDYGSCSKGTPRAGADDGRSGTIDYVILPEKAGSSTEDSGPWYGRPTSDMVRDILRQEGPQWGRFAPDCRLKRKMSGSLRFVKHPLPKCISERLSLDRENRIGMFSFNFKRTWSDMKSLFDDRAGTIRFVLNKCKGNQMRLEALLKQVRAEAYELRRVFTAMTMIFGVYIDLQFLEKEPVFIEPDEFPEILLEYGFYSIDTLKEHNIWVKTTLQRLSDYAFWIGHYCDFLAYIGASISILLAVIKGSGSDVKKNIQF